MVSFIKEKNESKKGDVSIMAIVALFLGVLIFVVMVGFAFKIPGLGGRYLGYVFGALSSVLSTIFDLLGKIIAPFVKEIQKATIWAALTISITLPVILAVKSLLVHGVEITWKEAIRNLFKLSFWKDVPSALKLSVSHWWNGVKSAFSSGVWKGLRYLGSSLIKNGWKIAAGFVIGVCIDVLVSFGLDYISYRLTGKGFAKAIDDFVG
ncbi:MAG: hypothetical protein ACP5O8_02430, partial [Candidatus Aenigmatarchaeota archaeon]